MLFKGWSLSSPEDRKVKAEGGIMAGSLVLTKSSKQGWRYDSQIYCNYSEQSYDRIFPVMEIDLLQHLTQ